MDPEKPGGYLLTPSGSIFDRYNILSEGDLRDAARRLASTMPLLGAHVNLARMIENA